MIRDGYIEGIMTQGDNPDWAPLVAVIGEILPGWFMWMFEVELIDGRILNAYKHRMTRQYIHLSRIGAAFDYRHPDYYLQVDLAMSINRAFNARERAELPADQLKDLDKALRVAGEYPWSSYNDPA